MATCEYEMLRQQKIADNKKRMESLGLHQVHAASNMNSQQHQTIAAIFRTRSLQPTICRIDLEPSMTALELWRMWSLH